MNDQRALAILAAYKARYGVDLLATVAETSKGENLKALLFDKQIEFVDDPARRKIAVCGRRAGKTTSCGVYLLSEAVKHSGKDFLYVAITRKSAKLLLWRELKKLAREHEIDAAFNESELIINLSNGSRILLSGAEDRDQIEKFRGLALKLAVIDESGSFRAHMAELVMEVLDPTLMDHLGTMCLIGTPNASCAGFFHDAATGEKKGWSSHSWTILDNPHIPHAENELERLLADNGWSETNPVFQREWRGKWVRSTDALVYAYNPAKHNADELPDGETWEYVLGIDLGYDDATAFIVCAFCRHLPNIYLVEAFKKTKMIPERIAETVRHYETKYNPVAIVADTGGLGKMIVAELNERHSLPIKPAEKTGKESFIELMNSDFHEGHIKVLPEASGVGEEWELLQWDTEKLPRRIEDGRFENHLSDAALYAWRECQHYAWTIREQKLVKGSPEWHAAEEAATLAGHMEWLESQNDFNGDF